MHRFVTIPISHFCEKARWALDHFGEPYQEDGHMPILHWRASFGIGAGRTVPALKLDTGEVLSDSSAILERLSALHPERSLYGANEAEAAEIRRWEERFDTALAPAVRRYIYFYLLPAKPALLALFGPGTPRWEQRVFSFLFPLLAALMRKAMAVHARGNARGLGRIADVLALVEGALSDGRPYLVGGRFSAADLSFASLMGPFTVPPEHPIPVPPLDTLPEGVQTKIAEIRARPAGVFVARLYAQHRRPQTAA